MNLRGIVAGVALLLLTQTFLVNGLQVQTKPVTFSKCPADPELFQIEWSPMGAAKITFSEDERRALEMVAAIRYLVGSQCPIGLGRPCSMNELLKSVRKTREEIGDLIGLARDPRTDSNYEYSIAITGADWVIAATPKRAGLGGFWSDGPSIHFNPKGQASQKDVEPAFSLEVKSIFCDSETPMPGSHKGHKK